MLSGSKAVSHHRPRWVENRRSRLITRYFDVRLGMQSSSHICYELTTAYSKLTDVSQSAASQAHRANLLTASALTGVKKLTRVPSGSRNKSDRFPQGIVV